MLSRDLDFGLIGIMAGASAFVIAPTSVAYANCSLPYPFTNGTPADGSQVIANLNAVAACAPPTANPVFTGNVGAGLSSKAGGQAFDQTLNVYGSMYLTNSFSNAATKSWAIYGAPYYSVSPGGEPDAAYLNGTDNGYASLNIGGGVSSAIAVSHIGFYTGGYSTYAGTLRATVESDGGLYMAGATGGSQGAGTINATTVYANGVALTSDARLKKDVRPVTGGDALENIASLRPVTFRWSDSKMGAASNIGFLAQDVQKVLPQLVSIGKDQKHLLSLNYEGFIPLLVGAVQELDRRHTGAISEAANVKTLEATVAAQEVELKTLHQEITELRRRVDRQTARN